MASGRLKIPRVKKIRFSRIARPFEHKDKIILRDYLALQRTTLANERTLFSYIRTSLYLILGGLGLLELEQFAHLRYFGFIALGVSLFLIVHGLIRYVVLRRKLHRYYDSVEEFEHQSG